MARCIACSTEMPTQTGRGGRRKRCDSCSPKRDRPERRLPTLVAGDFGPASGSILEATAAALRACERLESVDGAVALHLARLLDSGQYNAQGAAALAKAHAASMESALRGAGQASDFLDELRQRRESRRVG